MGKNRPDSFARISKRPGPQGVAFRSLRLFRALRVTLFLGARI
jgi:hypothetical protein